jgi:hypothetical protein
MQLCPKVVKHPVLYAAGTILLYKTGRVAVENLLFNFMLLEYKNNTKKKKRVYQTMFYLRAENVSSKWNNGCFTSWFPISHRVFC